LKKFDVKLINLIAGIHNLELSQWNLEKCNTKTQSHEGTKSEIDVLIEDKVLVEVKATEKNHPIYQTQVLTYLRLTGIKLGLLVNFGAPYVKDGVSRIINGIL